MQDELNVDEQPTIKLWTVGESQVVRVFFKVISRVPQRRGSPYILVNKVLFKLWVPPHQQLLVQRSEKLVDSRILHLKLSQVDTEGLTQNQITQQAFEFVTVQEIFDIYI